MAEDLLGNLGSALGGIVDGLSRSGLVPENDPGVKMLKMQKEVADLQTQETAVLAEIGRQAFVADPSAFPQADKLRLIQSNLAEAEEKLKTLQQEIEAAEQAKEEARKAEEEARLAAEKAAAAAAALCPSRGAQNPEGTKFCQECGNKLGAPARVFCTSCGKELTAGARFCGECGAKQ